MKETVKHLIADAARRAHQNGALPVPPPAEIEVDEPRLEAHGDFATNFAMVMAKIQKMAPRKIAEAIVAHLGDEAGLLTRVEIAGPGFINLFLEPAAWHRTLRRIQREDADYGRSERGRGIKIQVEFVSANPTGPLHVGHGRGAAVGDSVARILARCGYAVQKEYYINDSGRQIRTLGRSVYLRYKALFGETVEFPADCYQGDYINAYAEILRRRHGDGLLQKPEEEAVDACARFAAREILDGIREDLAAFGVTFDRWYSEQSLYDNGRVDAMIGEFRDRRLVYEKDGALWFETSRYGDEKDRVVVRNNGLTTYFASDIAYHHDKFQRGFERVIDVWGADHHGYIPRMRAVVEALGGRRDQFHVILVQLVNLLRGGEPVAMSTRAGEFVTLADVIQEVGSDAARFLFLTRSYESPLDFDLELAKQQTNENPVYYVQYVHARIASILRKAGESGVEPRGWDEAAAARLSEAEEIQLLKTLSRYPEVVAGAAEQMAPHRIAYYLMELAAAFHGYYNKHRVLSEDALLTRGRLCLVLAIKTVIRNGLALLGVGAPETM